MLKGKVGMLPYKGAGPVVQERREMADQPIPEEYFSADANSLFDLLAESLINFAGQDGRQVHELSTPMSRVPLVPLCVVTSESFYSCIR